MVVMLTTPNINQDANWYPDYGATNHLTHNFGNLAVGTEYGGCNQVHVGKGVGLPILNYGYSSFSSSICANCVFYLNNLLLVLSITKNLISVSQFAKDNGVVF